MAFTSLFSSGPTQGGLLGSLQGGGGQQRFPPILGVGQNLLAASFSADQTMAAIRAINSARSSQAVTISNNTQDIANAQLPVVGEESGQSLNRRVNEIRQNGTFIDLDDPRLEAVEFDPDRTATFALTIALDRLRSLAELAADRDTTDATREQIDSLFRQGLAEVRTFVETQQTDLLQLQFGTRSSRTESEISLGRDEIDYSGSLITSSRTEALEGVSTSDSFTIKLSNSSSGLSDTVTVNLSGVTGTLSLDNIVTHINEQIAAVQSTNSSGDPIFDDNGDPVSRYQTRFEVASTNGRFGLRVDSTLTEDVTLSAGSSAPGLVVASTVDPTAVDDAARVRISNFDSLSGTLTEASTFNLAATDIGGTKLLEETAEVLIPEREVDPAIASRRDQIREQAQTDVERQRNGLLPGAPDPSSDNSDTSSVASLLGNETGLEVPVTDVVNDTRVRAETQAGAVAVDSTGNIFVVGHSSGSFGSEINTASTSDVFLTKLDTQGNVIFSRLLGASDTAEGFAVSVDASDNVIIAGQTNSAITNSDLVDTSDAFVAKFNNNGDEQFRYQLDTFGTTTGLALTTDSTGDIFVGGSTSGSINSTSGFGGITDGLLLQLDGTTGALESSALIGGTGREVIKDLAFNNSGELVIALEESGSAVIRKRATTDLNTDIASTTLGVLGTGGEVSGLALDGNNVYVTGVTQNGSLTAGGTITPTGSESGSQDGFISGFTDNGTNFTGNFTSFVGTSTADQIVGVTTEGGSLYVAGVTQGTLTGETSAGASDSFVARINASTGTVEDQQQFGVAFNRTEAAGIAFTNNGPSSVLNALGLPSGELGASQSRSITDQTSARVGDFFTLEVDNKRTRIEIETGDTFIDIRRKIRVAALGQVKVTVGSASVGDGEDIKIETIRDGSPITLTPGTNGRDALERLGIESGTLIPTDQLFRNLDDPEQANELGGTFGLGIDLPINISDLTNATFSLEQLENAISTTGRAFRSLRPNPLASLLNDPLRNIGPPPPRIAAQIANFQSGLQRLQASSVSTGFSLLI